MKRYICASYNKLGILPVQDIGSEDVSFITSSDINLIIDKLTDYVLKYTDAEAIDKYGLYLELLLEHYSTYYLGEFDRIQLTLRSKVVKSKESNLGRDRYTTNSPDYICMYYANSEELLPHEQLDKFIKAIPSFLKYVKSEYNKINEFEQNDYPESLAVAAKKLQHWIVAEKLGNAKSIAESNQYLIQRTYNNKRCGYHNDPEILDAIQIVTDYADDNRWSPKELIEFAKNATDYVRHKA